MAGAPTPDAHVRPPKGILGRLGGMIMARANRDAAAQVIELLDVRPDDKVLEVGFGPLPRQCVRSCGVPVRFAPNLGFSSGRPVPMSRVTP